MSDIRLEEMPFNFEGKHYLLRCNMNVLADVQEAYGGSIGAALTEGTPQRSVLEFLAAMMNDYADDMGWTERYTAKQLGRRLAPGMVPMTDIMGLVRRSIAPPQASETVSEADTADPGNPGN